MNRTGILSIALVTTLSLREDSLTCDPALDLESPGISEALSRYRDTRAPEALAALPLKPESKLTLFHLTPLRARGIAFVKGVEGELRIQRAVLAACHEFTDAEGTLHKASEYGRMHVSADKAFSIASDAWLDLLIERFGNGALGEIAQVVIDRMEASPKALAPFGSPPGSMLPR